MCREPVPLQLGFACGAAWHELCAMPRRFRISILLGALLAWLAIDLACGATWRRSLRDDCAAAAAPTKSCCDQDAPREAESCPADACGLTCAAVLTAQVSDAAISVLRSEEGRRLTARNERAAVTRAPPPVPPPRG